MKKIDLEAQREAAAYTSDVGPSLDSSDESEHGPDSDFDPNDILAQRIWDYDDDEADVQYLVKYTDVPIHRCTWEPKKNITTKLFRAWKDKRDDMGKDKRDELGHKNVEEFEEAKKKAAAAKERRRHKRENLRKEAAPKMEETPPKKGVARKTPRPARGQHTPAAESKSKAATSSGKKRRVVMSSDDEDYEIQSSVEPSDDESSASDSEPLLQEWAKEKAKLRRDGHGAKANAQSRSSATPPRRKSLTALPPLKSSERKTAQQEQHTPASTGTKNSSANNTSKRFQQQVTSATKKGPPGDAGSSVAKSSTETKSPAGIERRKSLPTGSTLNQEQYAPRDRGPIKIVNQQKQPQRKEWNTQDKHFHKLKFRGIAEKRSRIEGTPDFHELEFVNGAPAGATKKPIEANSRAHAGDDPYSRREPGQRRLPEIDPNNGPSPTATNVALQFYETGKIPMACYDWKYGNNCKFSAERCRFLHREKDQAGKPLPLTTWDAKIPPKYKTPPQTCYWWFCEDNCKNSPDECNYAHENTGHLSTGDGKTIPIDPTIENGSAEAREACNHKNVTCWFWLRDTKGCLKSADQCKYAHRNTGLLGNTLGVEVKPIDPSEEPVRKLPDSNENLVRNLPLFNQKPNRKLPKFTLTCFFWLRGDDGCDKSEEECKFAHRNTGWLAKFGQNIQIDPNEGPKAAPRRRSIPTVPANLSLPAIDSNERPKAIPTGPVNFNPPAPNRDFPLHMQTCWFWNEYACKEPEKTCRSLHRYTGVVADPPRNWQYPPGWRRRLRDEPVPKRVDEPPSTRFDDPAPMYIEEPVSAPFDESISKTVPLRGGMDAVSALMDYSSDNATSPSQQRDGGPRITRDRIAQPDGLKHKLETVLPLDYEDMFRCNGDPDEDTIAGQNALVLYDPEEHMKEHELISRWLLLNHVNLLNSWMGLHHAWDGFKKLILEGESGIIIATPDFDGYASLPGFGDVLKGTVRLWSVGYQEAADYSIWDPKASLKLHYDRFEIFPHGGVIYITDDVFEKKPQCALKIVEHFFAMIEAGRGAGSYIEPGMYINDGLLLWRLGVRPELLKWIGDMCQNHPTEIEQGDPDYLSLEKLYVVLTDSRYCEPDGTFGHPADNRPLDFFPIISARQELAEDIGLYYEARKRSQHDANTDMAHHYSGLVVMERRKYRQYFVVHTEPGQVDWKETITNIDEVMTPERCIEYFEQDAKGNRFDNYAWAHAERKADSVAA